MFELLSAGYKTERGFMKKGEIYEGIIEKVEFPNKGFVWVDDQKVIVKNGIPGQKVRFMINKKRSGRAEGRLLEVLEKSPLHPGNGMFPLQKSVPVSFSDPYSRQRRLFRS